MSVLLQEGIRRTTIPLREVDSRAGRMRLENESQLKDGMRIVWDNQGWLNELLRAWLDAWLLGRLLALGTCYTHSLRVTMTTGGDDARMLQNSGNQD